PLHSRDLRAQALTRTLKHPWLPWRVIILSLLTAPVIGVAAAVCPARRAARQNPLEAISKQ
ncbi:hypothetical protein, partial [Streptomyces lavendulae]|uniref:hypothetical protein n=1 Tax=Streptomyces lavendulae TaxID=1914 RepID=UPI0031E90384